MTVTDEGWQLSAVVALDDLGPLEKTISNEAGQSTGIHPITGHPGWLAKLYRTPGGHGEATRLDDLIAMPGRIAADDASTLVASTSWPVARIADGENQELGCVIPAAPDKFRRDNAGAATKFREIDWLAMPDHWFARRNLPAPTSSDRLRVCRNLVAVAEVLERHTLVYSDWSYSNAFWCATDASVFVIDIDGCGPGTVPNIFQPNWDDPLTQRPNKADAYTDRYRVALLATRCLTGQRDRISAVHALAESDGLGNRGLREILLDILLCEDREQRPSMADLARVIAGGLYVRFKPLPVRSALPVRPVARPSIASTGDGRTAPANHPNVNRRSAASSTGGPPRAGTVLRWIIVAFAIVILLIVVLVTFLLVVR